MSNPPPVIAFELGVGEFRIVTQEAVYLIKVCPDLVEADAPGEFPGGAPGEAVIPAEAANTFFQELSQELFEKVGRLARQLSVSVEELPAEMPASALDDTGQQLEDAKGQLEEIIDITEKASMSIMDSADEIQDNLNQLRNNMDILKGLDFMAEAAMSAGQDPPPPAEPAEPDGSAVLEKLAEMAALLDRLLPDGPGQAEPPAAPAEPPAAPAAEKVTVVHFDVEAVFQTLYELCTNEAVKEHIRSMRESRANGFDGLGISAKLTELSAGLAAEDGFYNFPIPSVLKILYGATASEEFRAVLKKMNQTAAGIFLDTVLPVEGQVMEIEAGGEAPAAPLGAGEAPAGPAPAGPVPAELRTLRDLTAELDALVRSGPAAPAGGGDGLYTHILTQDRDALVQIVSQANELIHKTGRHLNRILETLSFQDLSGQRIKKVVALMGDIQAQLLSILVSVDTKIKVHAASKDQAVDPEKTEKLAQDEVDRALEKLLGGAPSDLLGPGAENRLNQNAVNDLLANLGF